MNKSQEIQSIIAQRQPLGPKGGRHRNGFIIAVWFDSELRTRRRSLLFVKWLNQ
ncbi:hypothetical protein AB3M80_26020 [Arthrospira platensis BEA 1257B]